MPVSRTAISTQTRPSLSGRAARLRLTSPRSVNLIAFPTRFRSASRTSRGSLRSGGAPVAIDWLALYAQDETGYLNLCHLVSAAHLDRPIEEDAHVTLEALEGRTDGLLCLTAGAEGALARLYAEGQDSAAEAYARRIEGLFPDRLYVEIVRRLNEVEGRAEAKLLDYAYARDLPIVGTNPCCFADESFHEAHDAMLCIANSSYIASDDRPRSSPDAWITFSATSK